MTHSEALAAVRSTLATTEALAAACAEFRAACESGSALEESTAKIRAALTVLQPVAANAFAPFVRADIVVTDAGGEGGTYWEAIVVVDGREVSGYSTESGVDAVIDALQRSKRGHHDVEDSEDETDYGAQDDLARTEEDIRKGY